MSTVESYDVFVSYARADRALALALIAELRNQGVSDIFIDEPGIDPWEQITDALADALARSKLYLPLYSTTFVERPACRWELHTAFVTLLGAGRAPGERICGLNPEPTFDHIQPTQLRDVLMPAVRDDAESIRRAATMIAEKVRRTTGVLGSRPVVATTWIPDRVSGSTRFLGRFAELWRVQSALFADMTPATAGEPSPRPAIITGVGGVGKTVLAEEYARQFEALFPGGIYWLRVYGSHATQEMAPVEAEQRWHDQLRIVAESLGIDTYGRDGFQLRPLIRAAMAGQGPSLWVVDDLPDGLSTSQVRRWQAPHGDARTLFTSRSHRYDTVLTAVPLGDLALSDAVTLLTRNQPVTEDERRAVIDIAATLGQHALAIDIAAAGVQAARDDDPHPFQRLLEQLRAPADDRLERIASNLNLALPASHTLSVAATILRSVESLAEASRDVLRLASVLAAAPIPGDLIATALGASPTAIVEPVRRAADLSLLRAVAGGPGEQSWQIHALVARTVRLHDATAQTLEELRRGAVTALISRLHEDVEDARRHPALRGYLPHARELTVDIDDVATADLIGLVARHDYEAGLFREALREYEHQSRHLSRLLGDRHTETLISRGNVAVSLLKLGDPAQARAIQEEILRICRELAGDEAPITLIAMNNLADTLRELEDLEQAQALHEQELEISRRVMGEDDPSTLVSQDNLARVYHHRGRLAEAKALFQRTLQARRRVLGDDHPQTLVTIGNLARVHYDLGELAQARQLHEEELRVSERVLGREHPDTLTAMNNLATTLAALGAFEQARAIHDEELAISRSTLGDRHPATIDSMIDLGGVLRSLGRLDDSRRLLGRAVRIAEEVLGAGHRMSVAARTEYELTTAAIGRGQAPSGAGDPHR